MNKYGGINDMPNCDKRVYYEPDKGGFYVEYKKDKIEKLEKDETM